MTKQTQASDSKLDKHQIKADSKVVEDQVYALFEPPLSLNNLDPAGDGALQAQAAHLGDRRLPVAQRQALAARIGRVQGNHHLGRSLSMLQGVNIQRQSPQDAGPLPGGVPAVDTTTARPTFTEATFNQTGQDFDTVYTPAGPVPMVGELEIWHWVTITFKPFTRSLMREEPYRSHRFTPDQLADFEWTDAERDKFTLDFMNSVQDAWSGKFTMHLDQPDFAEYRCRVSVNIATISDPSQAHTKITAQKIPKGAPRFRSFVSGDEATLEIRDPSETEAFQNPDRLLTRQVGPFGFDRADITSELTPQIAEIDQRLNEIGARPDARTRDWRVIFQGLASSEGAAAYNLALGQRRADAVRGAISNDLSWAKTVVVDSRGETNTNQEARFRHVAVSVRSEDTHEVAFNTAAHEAGHMMGLDDEYVEEDPDTRRFFGDKPEHYGDVDAFMGTDEANELLTANSDSIMSRGTTVHKGHYVYFLKALNEMTGKQWVVEE